MLRRRLGTSTPSDDEEEEEKAAASSVAATEPTGGDASCERRRRQLQEASRRSRKRQKHESMLCTSQINAVRQEIDALKQQLDALTATSPGRADARRNAVERLELERRITFLRDKLEAHQKWLEQLRNLLASAPLLDFALRLNEKEEDHEAKQEEETAKPSSDAAHQQQLQQYATVDQWRAQADHKTFSPVLIAKHVHAGVTMSQENARKLMDEFGSSDCTFAVEFASRGWSFAANLDAKLLTFRASRVVPAGTASSLAVAIWRSLQLDDILRTFVPIVQDVAVVYEAENAFRSVTLRVVQLESTGPTKSVVTMESLQEVSHDGFRSWQIAVETCDDPCLIAFATEGRQLDGIQAPASPAGHAAPHAFVNLPDIVLAATCYQHSGSSGGVLVQFAGSVRYDGMPQLVPPTSHVDLVQYLVCMMPVYEELHLVPRS